MHQGGHWQAQFRLGRQQIGKKIFHPTREGGIKLADVKHAHGINDAPITPVVPLWMGHGLKASRHAAAQ